MLNRRKFIKQIGIGASLTAFSGIAMSSCSKKTKKIVILHTNDVHSHIEPFPSDYKYPDSGGFAKRATLVDKIRNEEECVLLLDAGDVFQGTPYFNFFKGEIEYRLMSKLKYDAATLGNHEFDNGVESLGKAMSFAKFPFVVSNYIFKNKDVQSHCKESIIIKRGDIKIGILGLGVQLDGIVAPEHVVGVTHLNPLDAALRISKELKEEDNCDIVIAISHLGYKYNNKKVSDRVIAEKTEHIDVIVGGHTHTFLQNADVVTNKVGKNVYIAQTGWGGTNLGRIDFYI